MSRPVSVNLAMLCLVLAFLTWAGTTLYLTELCGQYCIDRFVEKNLLIKSVVVLVFILSILIIPGIIVLVTKRDHRAIKIVHFFLICMAVSFVIDCFDPLMRESSIITIFGIIELALFFMAAYFISSTESVNWYENSDS